MVWVGVGVGVDADSAWAARSYRADEEGATGIPRAAEARVDLFIAGCAPVHVSKREVGWGVFSNAEARNAVKLLHVILYRPEFD
jgi:hypothetical protein